MKGHLVIAGGNIKNKTIYTNFIKLAGGEKAKMAIIPTASEEASISLIKITKEFRECGVAEDNIIWVKIDPYMEDSKDWKKCGDDFENLDFLNGVTGIWFVGGDQIKVLKGFLRDDGKDTELLIRIKDILQDGGVIGGTSAGAAIMSETMIGGGTSFGALSMPKYKDYIEYRNKPDLENTGVLLIIKGLGFFKGGVIDQHFNTRDRIGRLTEVLFSEKVSKGYGISEDTAIVYDIEKGSMSVIGGGGITIIDITEASHSKIDNYSKITNLKISYLLEADIYNIDEEKFYLHNQEEINDNEYYAIKNYISNVFVSSQADSDNLLIDNKKDMLLYSNSKRMHYLKNYHALNEEVGYEIRIYKKKENIIGISNGNCSFVKATMDILPIIVKDEVLKEVVE